ncbi:carbohydrate ABC transporter permease [Niameybacter massiliensis]|uniref:Carbohydrate ABC transporter permease n=1 Tax=Holtiella tumoricola TaxID=3018743 RepID=A0AA42J2L4_9FIRM|nr:carbohydrate ABC transporter permease [Holtiella tumoricola]MDA3733186.1 carbohydrate ABC transporter permease [Holtiella tumoricola]
MKAVSTKIKETKQDRLFTWITITLIIAIIIIVAYPLYFVLVASVSSPAAVNSGDLLLYPKGFSLIGYENILQNAKLWSGYANTIFYTVMGTLVGVSITILAGYAFSRSDLPGRNILMGIFVFTMYFSGGLVPLYLVVKQLHLIDTRAIIILLGSVSVYNVIIARSFFASTIPKELQEAAFVDGCTNQRFFFEIVIPISKPIIAVITLYCAIAYWNSFFNAMIYLNDMDKYPLQLVLREILLSFQMMMQQAASGGGVDAETVSEMNTLVEVVKYGVIVVATIPVLIIYPFIQKYFVKGVMIGAVKG